MYSRDTIALVLVLVAALALTPHASRARVLPTQTGITVTAQAPAAGGSTTTISTSIADDPVAIFRAALTRSPWPASLHQTLEAIATCESRLDPHQIGDGGLAFGWLQIRADYHPALAARYDLLDGEQNLEAGWAVYEAAGWSFCPWSCWART